MSHGDFNPCDVCAALPRSPASSRTLTIAAPARSPLPLEPRLTPYGRVSSRASAASYRNSAAMSERTNDRTENIGARRLHTVMERLLDEISFDAPEMGGREVVIDADYVRERLNWPALLPLPAALDALVTGLAFLLLARLVLEPGAQAGGRLLPLGHGGRLLLAPAGIVHRMVHFDLLLT